MCNCHFGKHSFRSVVVVATTAYKALHSSFGSRIFNVCMTRICLPGQSYLRVLIGLLDPSLTGCAGVVGRQRLHRRGTSDLDDVAVIS